MIENKYLVEAFQALNILEEEVFDVTSDGINKLKNFENEVEEVETIIDPLAQTEEELQDSYLGKAILDCIICQSKIYKDATEVIISEDETLANIGENCPYCQSSDGYKIIGQVAEFKPEEEIKVTVEDEVIEETNKLKEDLGNNLSDYQKWVDYDMKKYGRVSKITNKKINDAGLELVKDQYGDYEVISKEPIHEEFDKVEIETNGQKIKVETAPIEDEKDQEIIGELSSETEDKFKQEGSEYQDIEIDEFDEKEFDELGEKYLRRVYENVQSYKTIKGSTKGNTLKLEGVITFKSGKKAKTNFVFEAKSITKTGKLKFLGENRQFARGRQAFVLSGKTNKGKLIAESLTYNYRAKDGKTASSKKIYGTVTKRKK